MADKTFSMADVAAHSTKDDLYLVVHDKVYNCSSFVDEHPGGEEVMLDVGGQDSTDAFEDVGHSDEARSILDKLLVGTLKRDPNDPGSKSYKDATSSKNIDKRATTGGMSSNVMILVILVGAGLAIYLYRMLQSSAA